MLLLPVFSIALLFSLSIFVHELGHFLAARALGMAADVFSIGMGPALWKRRFGATVWKIGAIPFGGYVALPQMDPNSFLEGRETGDRGQGAGDRGQETGDRRRATRRERRAQNWHAAGTPRMQGRTPGTHPKRPVRPPRVAHYVRKRF